MNTNKFTFSRFASFFRWFAAVSMKQSLMILSVIAAVAIVAGLVSTWSHYDSDGRIYAIILFVASGVAGSMCLSSIDKQTVRQQFISIPASNLEKYLAVFTLQIIMFVLIFGIIAAADGIWANSPGFMTFLGPFTLIFYWMINVFFGLSVRKFAFLYGTLCGAAFNMTIIREIKSLLGGEDGIIILGASGIGGIGDIIFSAIVVVPLLLMSYFMIFKKITLNTIFMQTQRD
ncbi:MAG: hypothetical protein J6T96_08290 [Bacteroidales bacterium]|nr:hypothetical protein [Bacteroidales bacterium]